MQMKMKAEALGAPFQNKDKNAFLRKYLVSDGAGGREVITLYSRDLAGVPDAGEIIMRPAGDFYFVV